MKFLVRKKLLFLESKEMKELNNGQTSVIAHILRTKNCMPTKQHTYVVDNIPIELGSQMFTSIVCKECGHTEFYKNHKLQELINQEFAHEPNGRDKNMPGYKETTGVSSPVS
jgi:predicted nucleic-acid-binding Zn-ribbon protein